MPAKAPLGLELVARVCEPLGHQIPDVRDRAIVTFGFFLAHPGASLSALDVADVAFVGAGILVELRGRGAGRERRRVLVPFHADARLCGVRSLCRWLDVVGIGDGALFRGVDRWGNVGARLSRQDICRVIQRRCAAVGLTAGDYGSRSLRSTASATRSRPACSA